MSFTTNIKEELTRFDNTKLESIAELSGFLRNNVDFSDGNINLATENATVAKRIYSLVKDIYDVSSEIETRKGSNFAKNNLYMISIDERADFILKDLSVIDENNKFLNIPSEYIIGSEEELRAYLRGAFLACGSINDPKTSRYHFELYIDEKSEANFLNNILNDFELNSKVISRDKGYMVYIKEAEKIGDFLRIISASRAIMYYEDIRIYRDHKNMANRLNNCEQANTDKILETASNQVADIEYLKDFIGLELLDDKTKEAAEYRLKYPEASLLELSEIISYETGRAITKSGLNHRFRKIRAMVKKIKDNS